MADKSAKYRVEIQQSRVFASYCAIMPMSLETVLNMTGSQLIAILYDGAPMPDDEPQAQAPLEVVEQEHNGDESDDSEESEEIEELQDSEDPEGSDVSEGSEESGEPEEQASLEKIVQEHDSDESNDETKEEYKQKLMTSFAQMMFVSGETAEASAETTGMIEEIVRQQVIEMLTQCTAQAYRRGVRSISTDDLIFLIRHDKAKVSRLRTFLSWKDVRKNVKDSDDKGGGDAADFAAGDDPIGAGVVGGGGPTGDAAKKNKKAKVGLPWEVASFYSETVPERDDEEDEDEEEMNYATLQRLKNADERTKNMTKDEYVHWSDCRQASFTFRKGKRFKEWAGFGIVTDSKPNDDIVDILGFLTFEIVQTLTEEALKVKEAEDQYKKKHGGENQNRKRKRESGLFDPPEEGRTPIEPRHVEEAFRRLQHQKNNKGRALRNFGRALHRTPLKLI